MSLATDMQVAPQLARAPADDEVAELLAEQRLLTQLGLVDLRARWSRQPVKNVLIFGSGEPAEQTISGNPQEAFHGFVILNRTGKTVQVGFEAKGAVGSPLTVPPGSGLVWAAEFRDLSIAALAEGPEEQVVVLRLPYPPAQPMLFPYTPTKASVARTQPTDFTVAAAESVTLLAANPLRLGMEIVNTGASAVRLGLGEAAKAKNGLYLTASGGTWNGQLSAALWLGSVTAICEAGGATKVAVVEV